jgi:hypothetical protein
MSQNNLMLSFPICISKPLVCENPICPMSPWGAPLLYGFKGYVQNEMENKETFIGYEWPIPLIEVQGEFLKNENELLHMRRILNDYFFSKRDELFPLSMKPGDRPDFVFENENKESIGVDLANYTLEDRRDVNARFEKIKDFIRSNYSYELSHLRGHVIYFWWPEIKNTAKPNRTKESLAEILKELKNYQPKPTIVQGNEIPDAHPGLHVGQTKLGANFYAHPIMINAPNTRFFLETGFELGLAFSTHTGVEEVWAEINRLIEGHDNDKTQKLIITAGAPNRKGYVYLSEEHLIRMAIANPKKINKPKNLTDIYVHLWTSGEIYSLYPDTQLLSPAVFPQGFTISCLPFIK